MHLVDRLPLRPAFTFMVLLAALLATGPHDVATAQAPSAADGPWSGEAQCVLSTRATNYEDEQTHTWRITGGSPLVTGSARHWPAVWSVRGSGRRILSSSRPAGSAASAATTAGPSESWTSNVPETNAPIAVWEIPGVRGANRLKIGSQHGQKVVSGAMRVNASSGQQLAGTVYEWQFPSVEDAAAATTFSGTRTKNLVVGPGWQRPHGAQTTETCTWNFTRVGAPSPTSSLPQVSTTGTAVTSGVGLSNPRPSTGTHTAVAVKAPTTLIGPQGATATVSIPPTPSTQTPVTPSSPSTPPRLIPSTTGRTLTESVALANAWNGWVRCQITTSAGSNYYSDQHTQTWTISGAPTVDAGREVYPATWSVIGSGGASRGLSGGEYAHSSWELNTAGIAASLAIAVRASDSRLVVSSAHAPLQSDVYINAFVGDETGRQTSAVSTLDSTGTIRELLLPVIEDAATSTSLSGSTSPSVTYPVSPNQPADARTTASCTWSFAKGTFSAAPPPVQPPAKTRPASLRPSLADQLEASRPVRVLTPNGSEDWAVNTTRSIEWTHTLGASQRFDIDISVDGGTTWLPLGRNVAGDGSETRGSLAATMPAVGSTAALVRVSPAGNAGGGDVSNSGFKLGAAWMRIMTPVSASVRRGDTFVMQVDTNLGVSERYTVAVTYDNLRWETLTTSASSGMSLPVRADAPPSGTGPSAMVRVTSNTVPNLTVTGWLRVE